MEEEKCEAQGMDTHNHTVGGGVKQTQWAVDLSCLRYEHVYPTRLHIPNEHSPMLQH